MSTSIDKIEIDCGLEYYGQTCDDTDANHEIRLSYFPDGVEITIDTCEGIRSLYMLDTDWNKLEAHIVEINS